MDSDEAIAPLEDIVGRDGVAVESLNICGGEAMIVSPLIAIVLVTFEDGKISSLPGCFRATELFCPEKMFFKTVFGGDFNIIFCLGK